MGELPVVRRTTYVVGPEGAVEPYQAPPPPARLLTREERVDAYRAGLRATADLLRSLGFESHYECEHSYSMSYRGLLLDFRVQRPGQVAYISSRPWPGATGTKGRHGGTIYKLSDEIKSEFAVMITMSTLSAAPPVFVALDESLQDPAKHILEAIVGLLASLNQKGNRLGRSVQGKDLPCGPKELPEWL